MKPEFGEMLDTSPAQRARYYELLRKMTPQQKATAAAGASRSIRQLAMAGLRSAHPTATDQELKVRLTAKLYGRDVAVRLHGAVPGDL